MSYLLLMLLVPFGVVLPILLWGARRYERRRRTDGSWDEQGPREPTEAPPDFLRPTARRLPLEMGSLRWAELHGEAYLPKELQPEPIASLTPEGAWQLEPACDQSTFIRALPLLGLQDGVVVFEGTVDPKVAEWLQENASPAGPVIRGGTVWPASDWWYLSLDTSRLDALAKVLERAAGASIHLYVYDEKGMVIEWYDVSDLPLWIARRIGAAPLAAFAAATGGELKIVAPSA